MSLLGAVLRFCSVAICLFALVGPANAHFTEGTKIRTIILTTDGEEVLAYARIPAPLLFSDAIIEAQTQRQPLNTPFVYLRSSATGPSYRLSVDNTENDAAFASLLERALVWEQFGRPVTAIALDWRLDVDTAALPFATPAEAAASLASENMSADPGFGEGLVDVLFRLDVPVAKGPLTVISGLPPLPLVAGVEIDNHLLDARGESPRSLTEPGQLESRVTIDGSLMRTVASFVYQGVLHIVLGLDHVLLVVCLALGTGALGRLIWLVTAFTIGHSITLVATFLGTVPDWPWFIPLVETTIALSVLYAAFMAWRRSMGAVWVIAAIGLIHGLGFSFVLGEILGRNAPDLVVALASFNVGIEVGQLAILCVTLLAAYVLAALSSRLELTARVATLGGIAVIAAYWVMDRSLSIV